MIISRTPFRISFFGGGTDYPEFYREHGGSVLLTTINQYCYITVHRLQPFFAHTFKANYAKTETVLSPREFQHPLIRECLLLLDVREGMEIAHVADLPSRTGLGSSSSFTVGLLNALHACRSDRLTAEDLAREAIEIERHRVGDAGGHQDQYAAAYGGLIRLDFHTDGRVSVKKTPLTARRLLELESNTMLFFTGVEQASSDIATEQTQRTQQNVPALRQMQRMVDAAEDILTRDGDLDSFGRLLHHAWELKKRLASRISNADIDDAYTRALAAGALGGKILGAGGRGFLMLYVPRARQAEVRATLKNLREVPIAFTNEGSRIIFEAKE